MTTPSEQSESRYRRVESLYQRALDLPPGHRHGFLAHECDGEQALLREVEQLLEHFEAARDSFLNTPAHGLAPADFPDEPLPDQFGRYKVRGKLGEGGMGVVYRAEQENPKREVALKVIRPGVVGRDLLRRFELEATVLGRLKHAGIAQIYEASTYRSEAGRRPFFAMELIEGAPLIAHAAAHQLHTPAKLDLFLKICDAVNHAHQKGVVHRDLKPGNILVTGATGSPSHHGTNGGIPKILDFGVARAIDSDLQATTLQTDVRQVVGTLPYMSPEQVEGQIHLVDVRSDIYALGVILYELLAGHVPFKLDGKTVAAAARVICEDEPPPLSAVDVAYQGDLNTIVLKALEKDPERRYQSVSDLAADVRRYLNDEPIGARPATTIYQLRKFVRRNRGLVAGIAAAFVVLVLGVIVSVSFAVQRSRALAEANRQRDIAQAVNEFLDRDLLAKANPSNEPNRDITLREVVDRASEKIGERFPDEPLVEAAIRTTLSNTYKGLGEYAEASRHAKAALALLQSQTVKASRELIQTMNRVASLQKAQGHMDEAEKMFRNALQLSERELGSDDDTTMSITNNLALLLERRQAYEEAAALLEPLLKRRIRLLGEAHPHTMTTMNNLALVYVSMERFNDAEKLHVKELELSKRVLGPEHPDTLISMENLAVLYANRADYAKAEPLLREVIDIRTRILGPDHPRILMSLDSLAAVLSLMGRQEEAESILIDALARCDKTLGPEHPHTLYSRARLATVYLKMGRLDEAETIAREVLEVRKRVLGENHGQTGVIMGVLARIRFEQGNLKEAEGLGRRSYQILSGTFGAEHSRTRKVASELSDVFDKLGQADEAARWRDLAAK